MSRNGTNTDHQPESIAKKASRGMTWDSEKTYTHIAHALARGYTDLFYVNMDTDEFIEYHTDDVSGVLTEARCGTDFFEGCERDAGRADCLCPSPRPYRQLYLCLRCGPEDGSLSRIQRD